jgi:endonuclease III
MTNPGTGKRSTRRSAPVSSSVQGKRKAVKSERGDDSTYTRKNDEAIVPDLPVSSMGEKRIKLDTTTTTAAVTMITPHKSTNKKGAKSTSGVGKTVIRPTPDECEYAVEMLGRLHPGVLQSTDAIKKKRRNVNSEKIDLPVKTEDMNNDDALQASSCGKQETILDGVVSTMLSQNTTAANSTRAFANLKKALPDWALVADLDTPTQIETAIRVAGLAKVRAHRIWTMCRTLKDEKGSVSLEYLRNCTSQQIKDDLSRFPGLGTKTISCVLMFTLGRDDEFPVDTHVLR